ncbi:MAG: YggS family pyridoxal phosphate-dependent enzyme [Truepera sp.]|nr:YggS family pyridoxal phosphate-dependent enzyme [Truepera sp.]
MYLEVQERIARACARASRQPEAVKLIAVTKGRSPEEIRTQVISYGHRWLGESRIQEWRDKAAQLSDFNIEWHFVGNLQTNKVKYCTGFALIHSLNSHRLAEALQREGAKRQHVFNVLVEVNLAGETSKQGVATEQAEALVHYAQSLSYLSAQGLMTMAPYSPDPEQARPIFARLRALRDRLGLLELSMGMSGDFEVAIEEGATYVRIGSALFEAIHSSESSERQSR